MSNQSPDADAALSSGRSGRDAQRPDGPPTLATEFDRERMAADVLPTVAGDIRALAGDGFLAPFGFTSTEDADALEFGRPYGVFTIHKGPWFEFMGYWKAPILVHGEYRSMVKVRREAEGYLMVELGAASLAAQLAGREKVPALSAAPDVGPPEFTLAEFDAQLPAE